MKLALIGDPVEHSASPLLQRGFFAETGIDGTYEAIRVPAGAGAAAIARMRADGYRGLNVTTPLKEEAYAACEHIDETARRAASVNTIVFERSGLTLGCNTDGHGAVAAVAEALAVDDIPHGTRVLVLGVGPTARAAAYALSRAGWARVFLWNRTPQAAHALADHLSLDVWTGEEIRVAFCALPPDAELTADVRAALVTTPVVIDANYGHRAKLEGALQRPVVDGLAMLKASARASFDLWAEADRLTR